MLPETTKGSTLLVCPRDRMRLEADDGTLRCPLGHEYRTVHGIPILLNDEMEPTLPSVWPSGDAGAAIEAAAADDEVDPFVQRIVVGTCGNLYAGARLSRYPLPRLPLDEGGGSTFLDVGCNWGRWSIAAARAGYRVSGIDPSLAAVAAARRVASQLGVAADYAVADARRLPYANETFDVVFSYSVFQHFDPSDARLAVGEAARVLRSGGHVLAQMPNAYGLLNLYRQARRRFARATAFEVRYWEPRQLLAMFRSLVGEAHLEVDGFFSLNAQPSDLDLLPLRSRAVVLGSEALRRLSTVVPPLRYAADSLYVRAVKP